MKVLMVGSIDRPAPGRSTPQAGAAAKPQFVAACRALGGALARKNHSIMVGVPDWNMLITRDTVASHVIEGASAVAVKTGAPRHPIVFYGPHDPEPPNKTPDVVDTLQEFEKLPNLDLQERFTSRTEYKAKLIPNVNDVDVVMLVSGGDGTASIGYAAYSMNKPVIAITSLGGAARAIHDDVLLGEYGRFVKQGDVTETELRALSANWSADPGSPDNSAIADRIVSTTEKLVAAYGHALWRSRRAVGAITAGMGLLLLVWLLVYLGGSGVPQPGAETVATSGQVKDWKLIAQLWSGPLAFFALLYISACLGTGLRVLASYQSNEITVLTPLGLWIDLVVSLIVAFGLALFYLVGSISFTGTVVALSAGDKTFGNISVSMSLLGLAAGYLVPLDRLRARLETVVAEQKK